jgi:hypothetical protein
MVWGVIESFRHSLKYRGGWRGLFRHMYSVSIKMVFAFFVLSQFSYSRVDRSKQFPYLGFAILICYLIPSYP